MIREPVKVFYCKRSKRGSVRVRSSRYKGKCSYIQKFVMPSKMVVTPAFFFHFYLFCSLKLIHTNPFTNSFLLVGFLFFFFSSFLLILLYLLSRLCGSLVSEGISLFFTSQVVVPLTSLHLHWLVELLVHQFLSLSVSPSQISLWKRSVIHNTIVILFYFLIPALQPTSLLCLPFFLGHRHHSGINLQYSSTPRSTLIKSTASPSLDNFPCHSLDFVVVSAHSPFSFSFLTTLPSFLHFENRVVNLEPNGAR